jgi:hypothetical protein
MTNVCEICSAQSAPLLEFNKVLACAICVKNKIRLMIGEG